MKKNLRHLRNLRDKKTSQEKSVYICEICGTKFSSDFTDESEAILLIGLLTDLRGTLAAGQWLAPDMCCYCFWSRRFRR